MVIAELRSLLQDPGDLLEILGLVAPDLAEQDALLQAAADLAGRWPTLQPAQIRTFVRAVIDQVVVRTERIAIALSPVRLRDVLHAGPTTALPSGTDEVDNATVTRLVCAHLERRGGATKLIVPGRAGDARPPSPNSAVIKALVRAQQWFDQLQSGQAPGMRAIARAEGLTDRYVARILPLAFLAPDIKEAILCGTQPVNLTLDQLCRSLPLAWFDQRRVLGFKPICLSYDSGAHSAKMGRCQRGVCRSLQGFPSTA